MICHIQIKVLCSRSGSHRKVKQNDKLCPVQDSGSLVVFKVTARDQGHYKGPWGAFVTYCNISCLFVFLLFFLHLDFHLLLSPPLPPEKKTIKSNNNKNIFLFFDLDSL